MTESKHPIQNQVHLSGYEPPEESDWETGLHPMDSLLRGERLPHIWCQGCGLGTALTTRALTGFDPRHTAMHMQLVVGGMAARVLHFSFKMRQIVNRYTLKTIRAF